MRRKFVSSVRNGSTFYLAIVAAVSALALNGCGKNGEDTAGPHYRAELARTSNGVAHVRASDFSSLGYGMAYAYAQTYGLPVIVTRASNNFGPWQYPEKLIPLFVTNAIDDLPLPLYGDGRNVRDWLFVDDHCAGIDFLVDRGENSETYNIGGGNERENREITKRILELTGKPESLIKRVADRQGHDRRYSLSTDKLAALGFRAETDFDEALERTVQWYVKNEPWWRGIKERSAEFKAYYDKQYGKR